MRRKGSTPPRRAAPARAALGALAAAATLLALALPAAPASAEQVRLPLETFGSAAQPSFGGGGPLAVRQSDGDLYVADSATDTISRFKPNGEPDPFSALGTNVIDGAKGPGGLPCAEEPASCDATPANRLSIESASEAELALDESSGPAAGDLYLTEAANRRVPIFAASGAYLGRLDKAGFTPFNEVCGVAVDPGGAVYVSDPNYGRVYRFLPSANPPLGSDYEPPFFNFGTGNGNCNLAPGAGPSAGALFAESYSSGAHPGLTKWGVAGRAYLYSVAPFERILHPLGYDPANGDLFAVREERIAEYDASGEAEAHLVSVAKTEGASAVNGATDRLYVRGGEHVEVYGPPVTLPTLTTGAAGGLTPAAATLNGTVDPEGLALSECGFEYGSGASFSESVPCAEYESGGAWHPLSSPSELSGEGAVPVRASVSGLSPETEYTYRLAAANANGRNVYEGPPEILGRREKGVRFKTPGAGPATYPAEPLAGTTATLRGAIFAQGGATEECLFEYGETESYGHSAECEPAASEIPADSAEHKVAAQLSGLTPNGTTYHYRLVARIGGEAFQASDRSFQTAATVITKPATGIEAHALTLNGTVNPEEVTISSCAFEWGEGEAYGQSAPCEAPAAGEITGSGPVAVHARLTGLTPGATYHYRLAAGYEGIGAVHGADEEARTLGRPLIEAQWADGVLFEEATLKARIDPRGQPTTFRLEWGPSAAYGHTTPAGLAGEGSEALLVSRRLSGLTPGATYHYRFTAENAAGAVQGEDLTFTAYAHVPLDASCPNQALRAENSSLALPDCRAYEMVSPPEKNGGGVSGGEYDIRQASPDGDRLVFPSSAAFAAPRSGAYGDYHISRRGAGGWSTEAIDPRRETPGQEGNPTGIEAQVQGFSPDLRDLWLENENPVPLSADAVPGYSNLYRRDNETGSYEALTTLAPAPGTTIGWSQGLAGHFAGASADLSDQVFESSSAITPDAPLNSALKIYDFSAGRPHLVSILPDGSASSTGSTPGSSSASLNPGYGTQRFHHVVSADGSRVFWTADAGGTGTGKLYMRENPAAPESEAKDAEGDCLPEPGRACTRRLSPGGGSRFLDATPDGSRALLLSGGELEAVDVASGARTPIAGEVIESHQSFQTANSGFLGAGEDLSRVYFLSREVLPGAASAAGAEPRPGALNLYAWHDGAYAFIAALTPADVPEGNFFRPSPASLVPQLRQSRVGPDGLHLAFVSGGDLTGYDNHDARSGQADREVYLYDAAASGGEGRLLCVSCNPSGARPHGELAVEEERINPEYPPLPAQRPAAAVLPVEGGLGHHVSRALSADGSRVFFESYDALLPRDTNGTWDVYEWEAPGSGGAHGCHESAPDYFAQDGGCLYLISTGQSPRPAEFVDASADGRDAFIRTAASIDPRDNGAYDAYDARAGGGFPLPEERAACEGEACQSPPPPPRAQTPASSAFRGPGNTAAPRACAALARRLRALAHRDRAMRHRAGALVHRAHRLARRDPRAAHALARRAHRLAAAARRRAKAAKRLALRTKRCRRTDRKGPRR